MRKDLVTFKNVYSPFLLHDKDMQLILQALFVQSRPYSDTLKRLLVINSKDCLDQTNAQYKTVVDRYSLPRLMNNGYIRLSPKVTRGEHEDIKSYIIVSFDNFLPAQNPQYMDYDINFDIVCYTDAWVLENYQIRPLAIAGYIDGILNSLTDGTLQTKKSFQSQIKLTGIGQYRFQGCKQIILNEELAMYTLSYRGLHFSGDKREVARLNG